MKIHWRLYEMILMIMMANDIRGWMGPSFPDICLTAVVGIFAKHKPSIKGLRQISSLDPALCCARVEDIHFSRNLNV